ncbi:hypothetical protein [Streptomyces sp. MK37H]|uniref:hypothetical protein n=1 Tax=Streptomyces sp. MK37H TaxID=2699117 RepID=UPI001B36527E|nr:hypothetical protein [Streptomyces sp. MK37H]
MRDLHGRNIRHLQHGCGFCWQPVAFPAPHAGAGRRRSAPSPRRARSRHEPWNPQAPAYTGGGTHSVTLFKGGPDFDESGTESDAEADDEPKLPDKWAPSSDPELIVCEFLVKESVGGRLIACEYEELGGDGSVSTRVPVYSAGYSYRVLEAKTGRLVDPFNLSGSVSAWDSCPVEQSGIASSEAAYQHVSSRDLTKRLRFPGRGAHGGTEVKGSPPLGRGPRPGAGPRPRSASAWERRKSAHVLELRSGAGSMPASLRIFQTVDAATFTPSTSSSP